MEASDRVYFKDRQSCRRWFERHHLERDHIWVVAFKKHTGEPCVGYDDLVEEAICFGWIDGIVKGVDEDRFLRRLSPRRAKSVWSATNVKRARRMIAAGLMTPAGRRTFDKRIEDPDPEQRAGRLRMNSLPLPQDFRSRLEAAGLLDFFHSMAPSHRREALGWITEAKREETRKRRIAKEIEFLKGKRSG